MKTKYVYVTTAILCIFVLLVIFKLNSYYKTEKLQTVSSQMSQQNLNLKTSISTQLGQLKNILSTYSVRIDDSKLNWMQMDPLTVMAQTHISKNGQFEVKNIFTKSGSKTERWTKDFLQKALALRKYSGRAIHADLFQTAAGDKYLALSFVGSTTELGSDAVTVVGDANYFQKFFDLNRSKKITHLVMTNANVVAGHSESEYVASLTAEGELNPKRYFAVVEELRSSNLKIISYVANDQILNFINIPFILLGLILGFSCVLIGILFYAFRPIEKTIQAQKTAEREAIYQEALQQSLKQAVPQSLNIEPVTASNLNLKLKPVPLPEAPLPVTEFKQPDILIESMTQPAVSQAPIITTQHEILMKSESSLNSVIESAIAAVESMATAAGVHIHKDLNSNRTFEFDPARFQKMFEHILKNSIEAVRSSETKKIYVRSIDGKGTSAVVEIQDTGVGIPAEQIEKIWQPYFTTKEKVKHHGLGLSESLSVARRYGADLSVQNNASGVGVTVKLMMGFAMDHDQHVESPRVEQDLDLDQILNFDESDDIGHTDKTLYSVKKPSLDLEKEFATTQFKIDRNIVILEEPQIEFKTAEKKMDQFKVQIRGPQKS